MKKRIFSLALALVLLASVFSAFAIPASAEKVTTGYYTYALDENGNAVIYEADAALKGDVIIPELLDGHKVIGMTTQWGYSCFNGDTDIKSVEFPDSMEYINNAPFGGCTGLTSVKFGKNLKTIGARAFQGCISLEEIVIPENVTEIGEEAFSGCTSLSSVEFNDKVETIAAQAFYKCVGLTDIKLPDTVTKIGKSAFSGCSAIITLDIGDGVVDIGNYAFYNCSGLRKMEIPETTLFIGAGAFENCSALTNLSLNNTVTSIGYDAFKNCSKIKGDIVIPDSVTTFEKNVFYGCKSIESAKIGIGITEIPSSTFNGCESLESVFIGDNVVTIGEYAFNKCISLNDITWGESLKTIDYSAFKGCTSLTVVHIPDTVTKINGYAFANCSALRTVTLSKKLKSLASYSFGETAIESIVIPEGITELNREIVRYCDNLKYIYLPSSLQNIELYTFAYASAITDVYYAGTEEEWNDYVTVDTSGNGYFTKATYHFEQDTVAPSTEIVVDTEGALSSHNITLKVEDNEGIAGYYWGTSSIFENNEYTEATGETAEVKMTITEAGTYYLVAKDVTGHISNCATVTFHDVTLDANGGTVEPEKFLAVRNVELEILPTNENEDLVFVGWAVTPNAKTGSIALAPTIDGTYYAIWEEVVKAAIGDVDNDGELTADDYIVLKRLYFGNATLEALDSPETAFTRCDVDKDGELTADDYIMLKRAYFGTAKLG